MGNVTNEEMKGIIPDKLIGHRVIVDLKKYGQRIEGMLLQSSKHWFNLKRDNGRVETYMYREATITGEANNGY
jgi:hypothetical protein